jgi:hypothetical protein
MALLMVEKSFTGGRLLLKTMLSAEPMMSARG